jgi:hydroxybutyrate-dimer hydrolase
MNIKPDFIQGQILKKTYDGRGNDLLTGGLGKTGLESPPPAVEDFSAEALRTLAIYNNYRALVDITRSGGYGVLYGPGVGTDGHPKEGDGKIAGKEYLAYADDGTGKQNVVLMVQIPDSFDPKNPCIITAPSSGSRGVYGALPTVGEWGLKRGFAVTYTDKGTGTGVHDLDTDTVNLITGERKNAGAAGKDSHFTANTDPQFIRDNPHRIAFKQAHSRQNPEADWGKHVLQSVQFAFYILNLEENFGKGQPDGTVLRTITRENTIVIASSISNGGDASLRAAEQDTENLIDGIAVSEPNVMPAKPHALRIRQGDNEWTCPEHIRSLFDYYTLLNLYQPCANLDPAIRDIAPLNRLDEESCVNRCNALAEMGLLTSKTIEERAKEAQEIINRCGILKEQNLIQPSHHFMQIGEGIAVTYANAYGRFGVEDNLCGYSFAAADPETKSPAPLPEEQAERLFGDSTGIPPTAGIELINNHSTGGPRLSRDSISASGQRDQNLDGALYMRRLAQGKDESGNPLSGKELEEHTRIIQGISEVQASGNLRGLPAIIVNGRNDAILPPNHTSRAYAALNSLTERENSNLRYYEVTRAHHLDFLNLFQGFNSRYIPLIYYFIQALDLLYDHLRNGTPLPPHQVVRTTPRGISEDGSVPDITRENMPGISANPAEKDRITIANGTIEIPE